MSFEHSLSNESQNSTTPKRILLPLGPDFNQMSDPSFIIDPPVNTWQSTDRHTSQTRMSRRDQPKTKHKSKKRRHKSSSPSFSSKSSSLSSHRRSKIQRGPRFHMRGEEDVLYHLLQGSNLVTDGQLLCKEISDVNIRT